MKDYISSHGIRYEKPQIYSVMGLPVLQFLNGQPWDEFALNFVCSLNPDCIRVVKGEEKTDSWLSRVTVYINSENIITGITQETTVGLEGGYEHGHALYLEAIRRGIKLR